MTIRLPDPRLSNALLIGTARFTNEAISDMPSVANNVSALAEALTDPNAGVVDPARCLQLINPRSSYEFGAALGKTVEAAADTLIIYYAGHGFLTPRLELHLALADTHPDQIPFSAVSFELLRRALADSSAKNRILILDCCFSGHAAIAMTSVSSAVTAAIDISGTYTLTSAPADSPSIAPPGEKFTAFTGELLRVLHEGIPDAGELISLEDIYLALIHGLRARSMPRPQKLGSGLADKIALGRNAASGNRGTVVRTAPPTNAELGAPPVELRRLAVSETADDRVGSAERPKPLLIDADPEATGTTRDLLTQVGKDDSRQVSSSAHAVPGLRQDPVSPPQPEPPELTPEPLPDLAFEPPEPVEPKEFRWRMRWVGLAALLAIALIVGPLWLIDYRRYGLWETPWTGTEPSQGSTDYLCRQSSCLENVTLFYELPEGSHSVDTSFSLHGIDSTNWNFNFEPELHDLTSRCAPDLAVPYQVYVDGERVHSGVAKPAQQSWQHPEVSLKLPAGATTVRFTATTTLPEGCTTRLHLVAPYIDDEGPLF